MEAEESECVGISPLTCLEGKIITVSLTVLHIYFQVRQLDFSYSDTENDVLGEETCQGVAVLDSKSRL